MLCFFLFQIKVLFDQRLIFESDKVLLRPLFLSSPRIFSRDSPSFNNFPNAFLIFYLIKSSAFIWGPCKHSYSLFMRGIVKTLPAVEDLFPMPSWCDSFGQIEGKLGKQYKMPHNSHKEWKLMQLSAEPSIGHKSTENFHFRYFKLLKICYRFQ